MNLSDLRAPKGATTAKKRVGRGHGSGTGKTSGRGQKGYKSRSGSSRKYGFEGGQNPLIRRLPKQPGFTNLFRTEYQPVNVSALDIFDNGAVIDSDMLAEKGLVRTSKKLVKILGDGEVSKKLTVKASAFSATAVSKIEKAGGKVEKV